MRVFVASIVVLLLRFCSFSEEAKCDENEENVTMMTPVFNNRTQVAYGVIQTPNFPQAFPVPMFHRWIIDASNWPANLYNITIYLTQMYISEFYFIEFTPKATNPCRSSKSHKRSDSIKPDLQRYISLSTTMPYMLIELSLMSLYDSHIRTDYFLTEYGFNITYEISPNNITYLRNDTCTLRRCNFAGSCFVDSSFQNFYCDCKINHSGPACEFGPSCNPSKGINDCENGGTCRSLGGAAMRCDCKPGYKEPKCEKEDGPVIKECPGEYCDTPCFKLKDTLRYSRPCSCHNGTMTPQGWVKYEGKFKLVDPSLPIWDRRNSSTFPPQIPIIEKELTKKLKGVANDSVADVTITSVSAGSEFVFQFVGAPNIYNIIFQVLTSLKSHGQLMPGYTLGKIFGLGEVQPSLNLTNLVISQKQPLNVGKQFSIQCSAIGSAAMKFSWYMNDFPFNKSIAIRHIDEDLHPRSGSDESSSVLSIANASPFDSGTFTCKVSDKDEDKCTEMHVEVILPPQIEIMPLSLTLLKNDAGIVNCIDSHYVRSEDSENPRITTFEWEKNNLKIIKEGDEVAEDLYPQGKLLRIIKATESARYVCVASNLAGESRKEIQVEVLDSRNSPSCRDQKEIIGGETLQWKWSAPNLIAMQPCPKTSYVGYVQRACQQIGSKVQWGRSDFSKCLCTQLHNINNTLQNIKMGYAVLSDVDKLWALIGDYVSDKAFLFPGEGEKIISVLYDISHYLSKKGTASIAFPNLFEIATKLLKFPGSCVQENSVVKLNGLMSKMILNHTNLPPDTHLFPSEVLVVESMKIVVTGQFLTHPNYFPFIYDFPRNNTSYPKWLDVRAQVPIEKSTTLAFLVFRNLTNLLSARPKKFKSGDSSLHLVSSIVNVDVSDIMYFSQSSMVQLFFTISPDTITAAESKNYNLTCAAMKLFDSGIEWIKGACTLKGVVTSYAHCECDRYGQFAVLLLSTNKEIEEYIVQPFNWCVITGSVVCVVGCTLAMIVMLFYVRFKLDANSLYTVKMIVCLTIIMSIFIILSLRSSASSIPLSICLCSLMIISLCCQLTKSLNVLLTTQREIFPWLRSVSLLTLLSAVSFGSVLPVWTAAAVLSHNRVSDEKEKNVSVLHEKSPVFATFVAMVVIIVLSFLVVYYKAVLKLRELRAKCEKSKYPILDHSMKTLHRALLITLSTLLTVLATILYGNISNEFYQYFFGLTAFMTGIIVLFSYTIKSEYPIPLTLTKSDECGIPDPERPGTRDFERGNVGNTIRTLGKSLENGPVSSVLLQARSLEPQLYSDADTTMDTFVGSSIATTSLQGSVKRTSSVSSMKRPSISSNKIPRSNTNPTQNFGCSSGCSNDSHGRTSHRPCQTWCKKNKSQRSHSNSMISSQGFGSASSGIKPERGQCYIRDDASQADYVLPSSNRLAAVIAEAEKQTGPCSTKDAFSNYVPPQPQYPTIEREKPEFRTFHQAQYKVDVEQCEHNGFDTECINREFPGNNFGRRDFREERIVEGEVDSLERVEEILPCTYYTPGTEQTEINDQTKITELAHVTKMDTKQTPLKQINKSDVLQRISHDLDILLPAHSDVKL